MSINVDIINDDIYDMDNIENTHTIESDTIKFATHTFSKKKKDNTKYDDLAMSIFKRMCSLTKELRDLKLDFNKLTKLHSNEIKKNSHSKQKRNDNKKNTGFMEAKQVPKKLCEYLNLPLDTILNRNDVVKKLYKKIKDEGLQYEDDKRVIHPNDALRKLFNLPESVNECTDPRDEKSLSTYSIQTYTKELYIQCTKKEDVKKNKIKKIKKKVSTDKNSKKLKKKKGKRKGKKKIEIVDQ